MPDSQINPYFHKFWFARTVDSPSIFTFLGNNIQSIVGNKSYKSNLSLVSDETSLRMQILTLCYKETQFVWVYIYIILLKYGQTFLRLMKVTLLIKRLQRPYLEKECTANKRQQWTQVGGNHFPLGSVLSNMIKQDKYCLCSPVCCEN